MERRLDYIERQIDLIGDMLQGLLGTLLRTEPDVSDLEALEATVTAPISDHVPPLSIEQLADIDNGALIDTLVRQHGYQVENIRRLADVLFELSRTVDLGDWVNERTLTLYEYYLSAQTTTIEFGLFNRINELKSRND